MIVESCRSIRVSFRFWRFTGNSKSCSGKDWSRLESTSSKLALGRRPETRRYICSYKYTVCTLFLSSSHTGPHNEPLRKQGFFSLSRSSGKMLRLLKYGLLLCSAVTAVTAQQYNYKTTATGGSPNAPAPTAKNGVHTVLAGQNGIFTYNPDTLHVPVGDVVEFNFFPPNHSMAQASFNNPCHPMSANSIFAGYFPTSAPESVSPPRLKRNKSLT